MERKTSKEWYESVPSQFNLKILDPDGWDRKNLIYSFNEELITKAEFLDRLSDSTISCHMSFFEFNW